MVMLEFLKREGVSDALISEIKAFRAAYDCKDISRIPNPQYNYYGTDVWEQAISTVLAGEHLLLTGPKATGKNVLAQGLAAAFGRPAWDVSLHINTDAATLIGTDTYSGGEVHLRRGPVLQCAQEGGFGVLDEINMAKNEALAVLHAVLDFRRVIDVPGYERIVLHDATRFIATMNYGYAGTREINEALASRFMIIRMPVISEENLQKLILERFPSIKKDWAIQFSALFHELRRKCEGGEISSRALDLRGLLASVMMMQRGLSVDKAMELGLVNKCFDDYERQLVLDLIRVRIPTGLEGRGIFSD